MSVWAEIWYLGQFEYAGFNGSVHVFFFFFRSVKPTWPNFVQVYKIVLSEVWYKD